MPKENLFSHPRLKHLSDDSILSPHNVFETVNGTKGYFRPLSATNTLTSSERIIKSLKNQKIHSDGRAEEWLVNLPPVPFTKENRKIVFDHLYAGSGPLNEHRSFRERSISAEEPMRSHLRRLYISLDAYFESKNPVMSFDRIAQLVLEGPSGIASMKRIRTKSLITTFEEFGARMLEVPEWWEELEGYEINDIGDIFNYQYLLDWELPDEEDFIYGRSQPKISAENIRIFKERLRDELPERSLFEKIDPREILMEQTSSSTLMPDFVSKAQHWTLSGPLGSFSNRPLKGVRTLIHTQTGSSRDTVILPIDQSNSVKLIDRQIRQILAHMRGNAMFDDPLKIEELLLKDRKNYLYFLNRDIKKEGLTKPRELLHAIFEVLEEVYPDLELDQYRHIYDGYTLIHDGIEEYMFRGHGLGMANSLTTLMQLVIFYVIQDRMIDEGFNKWDLMSCKAYNDDFYACFKDPETLELYGDLEPDVFVDYALIPEPRKSLIGPFSILCENYSGTLNNKESYVRREILMALACCNITQAKAYISSLTKTTNSSLIEEYLVEIISYWGTEMHEDEINQPYRLGGWVSSDYRGVSNDLNMIEDSPYLKSLYEASKESASVPRRAIRTKADIWYISPLEKIFKISSLPDPAAEEVFNLGKPKNLRRKFVRLSNDSSHVYKVWSDLKIRRQKAFGRYSRERITKGALEREIIDHEYAIDFIPNETAKVSTRALVENSFLPVHLAWEHYRVANPRIAYLKFHFPSKFEQEKEILATPVPLLMGMSVLPNLDYRAEELYKSKFIEPNLRSDSVAKMRVNKHMLYSTNEEFNSSFINPKAVINYYCQRSTSLPMPSYVGEGKRKLIELVRPWEFTIEELRRFYRIPYAPRMFLKKLLNINLCDDEDLVDQIVYTEPKKKPKKKEASYEALDDEFFAEEIIRYRHDELTVQERSPYAEDAPEYGEYVKSKAFVEAVALTDYSFRDAEMAAALKLRRRLMAGRMSTHRDPREIEKLQLLEEELNEIYRSFRGEETGSPASPEEDDFDYGAVIGDGAEDELFDAFGF